MLALWQGLSEKRYSYEVSRSRCDFHSIHILTDDTRHEEDGCPRREKVRRRVSKARSALPRNQQAFDADPGWMTAERFL